MTDIRDRALEWALGDDTGTSSKALMRVMLGQKLNSGYCYPHDGQDLGRCVRLLDKIPEWRLRLPEMKEVGPEWAALIDLWDELEAMYRADDKKIYDRMKRILEPLEKKRRDLLRLGPHASVYFGPRP